MGDTEDIQVSFAGENQNEEQETASDAVHKNDQEDTQNNCTKRLRSSWHAVLIGVLMMLLCVVTSNLFIQMHERQSLTAELQHMAEELRIKNSHLKQLLNSTHQNSSECGHVTLLVDAMLYSFTSLSAEKTKLGLLLKDTSQGKKELSLLLENTSQEKRQLEAKNKELHVSLNSALNNFSLLSAEKTQLSLILESTLQESAQLSLDLKNTLQEKTELSLLLKDTLQEKTHLEVENRALTTSLNSALNNFSLLSAEKTELSLLLENTSKEKTELNLLLENTSKEKTELSLLLENTSKEKTELSLLLENTSKEKTELSLLLENTSKEKTELSLLLENTSKEKTELNLLLENTSKEKTELSLLLENTSKEKTELSLLLENTSKEKTELSLLLENTSKEKTELSLLLENTSREKTELSLLLENTSREKTELNLLLENTSKEKTELNLLLENTSKEKTELSLLLENTSKEKTELSLLLENASKEKTELSLLLENTSQENRKLEVENKDPSVSLNSALNNFTSLSAEKTRLSLLLKNTMDEKTQVEEEKKELAMFLHSMESCNHVEAESRQLHLHLNASQPIISLASERWRQLLDIERQITMQLEELNKRQHSVLFSSKLSFLWRFCDRNTLQRSHCLPGWVEHASRCFFRSKDSKKWKKARRECLDMGADMAVVLNAEDQAFLTFQFVQQHLQEGFHSAWIGLQDMAMESDYFWVTGRRIHPDVTYWRSREPNNAMASWDNSQAGQDCDAIVPPTSTEKQGWLNSWDDMICAGERHYLCETTALSVT